MSNSLGTIISDLHEFQIVDYVQRLGIEGLDQLVERCFTEKQSSPDGVSLIDEVLAQVPGLDDVPSTLRARV